MEDGVGLEYTKMIKFFILNTTFPLRCRQPIEMFSITQDAFHHTRCQDAFLNVCSVFQKPACHLRCFVPSISLFLLFYTRLRHVMFTYNVFSANMFFISLSSVFIFIPHTLSPFPVNVNILILICFFYLFYDFTIEIHISTINFSKIYVL